LTRQGADRFRRGGQIMDDVTKTETKTEKMLSRKEGQIG
jgi:hypothetical protein